VSKNDSEGMRTFRLVGAFVVVMASLSCVDRTRVNNECDWRPESVRTLDLENPQDVAHLYEDAELVAEMGLRYADSMRERLYGIEGHGGLLEGGRYRDECLAKLTAVVASSHHIPPSVLDEARLRGHRHWAWDASVMLVFWLFYVVAAWFSARALYRRFPPQEGWASVVGPLVVAFPISLVGVQAGGFWAIGMEMVRIGNDHLGRTRVAQMPWDKHEGAILSAGIVVFLLVAAVYRVASCPSSLR
jgi:hypothetical protein